MTIDWNIDKTSNLVISSYAFAKAANLAADIRATGTVDFLARHYSKTAVDVEISCQRGDGSNNFTVAHIPKGAEKFSFLGTTSRNIFDGNVTARHYFRLTKKQGLEELKEYLRLVLEQMLPDVEHLEATLTLYKVPELETS